MNMWYVQHMIINIVPSFLWYYLTGNWFYAILFFISAFAADCDHAIAIALYERTASLPKIFKILKNEFFNDVKKYEEKLACVFHTVEFMILLGVLSFYFSFFVPILFGVMFHVLCDIVTVAWKKNKRIFFLTFFIIKYFKGGFKNAKKC